METIRVPPSCGIQDCTVRGVQHRFTLWLYLPVGRQGM